MNITAMNNYRAFYIWEYIVGIPPHHSCIPPFQHLSCSASLLYPEPYFPASLLSWIPLVLHPMLSCFPSPESHLSGIPTFLLWIFFENLPTKVGVVSDGLRQGCGSRSCPEPGILGGAGAVFLSVPGSNSYSYFYSTVKYVIFTGT